MNLSDQCIACFTIVRKEVVRFFRIWTQTLFPPIITQSLYFLIFGAFIGSQIEDINGVSYMAFIVPGLVMMSIISNSYVNVAGSFFSNKFQRSIEEIIVSPVENWAIIGGYAIGGMARGVVVGSLVFGVSVFFTKPVIHNFFIIIAFMGMTSIVFALGGLVNGILAQKFDDISIIPNFILIPLTYLGGVFYSVSVLPPFWQTASKFNPIFYMINGFRYGFYGFSDVNIFLSFGVLIFFAIVLMITNLILLRKGIGLRS